MVETFTRQQFEAALPTDKTTGNPLWKGLGLQDGEYSYLLPLPQTTVKPAVGVMVRSSVGCTGVSAESGEDSIRAFLVYTTDGKPAASKLQAYVTRVPGWQKRLTEQLRKLWFLGNKIGYCPVCELKNKRSRQEARIVKKEGPTKGRAFLGCSDRSCGFFAWLTEEPVSKLKVPTKKASA